MKTFSVAFILLFMNVLAHSQSITIEPASGIDLSDPDQSIKFPNTLAANNPMLYMFSTYSANSDRMLIAHSLSFPNYGLLYDDQDDNFQFLSNGTPTCTISVKSSDKYVDVNGATKTNSLQIRNGGSINDFVIHSDGSGNIGHKKGNHRLGINFIIATVGTYPSQFSISDDKEVSSTDPFLGEIIMFAGNFAPSGWAFCNGQLIAINSNQALFSILGTTYGGDGETTFALPDLRAAAPVHVGTTNNLSWTLGERY